MPVDAHLEQSRTLARVNEASVGGEQYVAVAETGVDGCGHEVHALGGGIERDIFLAPVKGDAGIDDDGEDEIEQHTAEHDEESLVGGFGAEFPRLWFLLHLLGVH